MKHRLELHEDANVNVNLTIPEKDLEDLIDKVVDAAITITVVITTAQIIKSAFTK